MMKVFTRFSFCYGYGPARRAFTLLELIISILVISLLSVITVGSIGFLRGAGTFTNGLSEIVSILEKCRTHAMANNTYVWVALAPATGSVSAMDGMHISSFYSSDRSSIMALENIEPLSRPRLVRGSLLRDLQSVHLSDKYSAGDLLTLFSLIQQPRNARITRPDIVASTRDFVLLRFSPIGELLVLAPNKAEWELPRWFEIGLADTRGGQNAGVNSAAIQLSGLTGQVLLFRQ